MKIVLSILFFGFCGFTNAQSEPVKEIHFTYDNTGNRTDRQIVELHNGLVRQDTTVKTLPMSFDSLLVAENHDTDTITKTGPMPKTLNADKDGVFNAWIGQEDIAIYPNPTQGYLTIGLKNFEEVKSCSVEIVDMNGRVVYQSTSAQRVYSVDLSNRANGNYYINLRVNGQIGSFVVVKQ